ncbi:10590_t:CDS:2 [Cetraspora pellucida]|uniref:10590_t:CDS:1 n=1 Tax=Cetraspora pellucida TaxID=1433469 RepID=A0A9N9EZT7_9GLOM|nr:10590_t:CDS:2 [Cetraspora pellucida]
MNIFMKVGLSYLVLIFTLFITTSNGATPISPAGRSYSCSVTINNKLYVFGGDPFGIIGTTQAIYLDISLIGTPNPWFLLTDIPTSVSAANAVFNGNNTVFLINYSTVYAYNISNNQWYPTDINGIIPQSRTQATAVIDKNGMIWYFGGTNVTTNTSFNDINYFDTITYSWSVGSTVNAPTTRFNMISIFLPSREILYIGGVDGSTRRYIDMAQGRELFTAILAQDGTIIIYGGNNIKNSPTPTMAKLNTNTSPYTWTSNEISSDAPQYLTGHVAATNGTHMILALGATSNNGIFDLTDKYTIINSLNYNIYTLNIQTNVWSVNSTTHKSVTSPTSSNTPNGKNIDANIGIIVVVIIAVILVIIAGVLAFVFYRKCKKNNKDKEVKIIRISGSNDNEQPQ